MTPNGVAFSVEAGDGWLSSCRGVLVVVVVVVLFWWWNDDCWRISKYHGGCECGFHFLMVSEVRNYEPRRNIEELRENSIKIPCRKLFCAGSQK
jgi:hypothetical protein